MQESKQMLDYSVVFVQRMLCSLQQFHNGILYGEDCFFKYVLDFEFQFISRQICQKIFNRGSNCCFIVNNLFILILLNNQMVALRIKKYEVNMNLSKVLDYNP